MKIQKIEKLKNGKYKLFFQDEIITTFDNVIIENNLLYKKVIDNNLYKKIIKDTEYYNIYNNVVKYILRKRRSEKEIRVYLLKFNLLKEDIEKIVKKLRDINLINDIEYCKAYINDKIYLSKIGINKIKKDLLQQNINYNLIEEELNKIDYSIFNDRLEKMIIRKIESNKKYSNIFLKNKILNEMVNLGYQKELVLSIIEKNIKSDKLIIENEFSKIYLRLSKKYNGFDLLNRVEQKLILKGFNVYEVKELIKNKTEE